MLCICVSSHRYIAAVATLLDSSVNFCANFYGATSNSFYTDGLFVSAAEMNFMVVYAVHNTRLTSNFSELKMTGVNGYNSGLAMLHQM